MNFLELCKRVRQDSGVSGEGPTSVTNQTGILGRFVTWVQQANNEIQLAEKDWTYSWAYSTGNTIANRSEYISGDFGLVTPRSIASVMIDGRPIKVEGWEWYVQNVIAKGDQLRSGKVEVLITKPDGSFLLFPTPTAVMPIHIEYYKRPVQLVNGTDIPIIPAEFHEAIVCRALMFYADYEEDTYMYNKKALDYRAWMTRMRRDLQPKIQFDVMAFE